MDEVAGYLPPTAAPPTKKPIMTLMKQARAFGVGVVLSTQNPVDVDYKALSNAGTWMIGRLQTDRDKQRLLDGMSAAAGGVDVSAVSDTISGLSKREFVLRRAGKDQPEVFTTRWAMSYLRGPLTRDQIAVLMAGQKGGAPLPPPATTAVQAPPAPVPPMPVPAPPAVETPTVIQASVSATAPAAPAGALADDESPLMQEVADGVAIRWADVAAPWLATIGGDPRGTRREPAIVARVALRYDDDKAELTHDEEYETVLFPLGEQVDVSRAIAVDYDDRDLRVEVPPGITYELSKAPLKAKTFWSGVERDLVDFLVRSRSLELQLNKDLKLYSRPGETPEVFYQRCYQAADAKGDEETAALRGKYQAKVATLQSQLQTAEDRADVLEAQQKGRRNEELLSTAGSILGGLLGGRRSRGGLLGKLGSAAGRRSRTAASGERLDAAENKIQTLHQQMEDLEADLTQEVTDIDAKWMAVAKAITTMPVSLEKTDVKVTQLSLVWVPVS